MSGIQRTRGEGGSQGGGHAGAGPLGLRMRLRSGDAPEFRGAGGHDRQVRTLARDPRGRTLWESIESREHLHSNALRFTV